ncbi:MAG TPA: hypothetical protein VGS20_12015 [Candidatus Acidoferrales bacterium]|nr:hypothetical protein [Candidatus Acidoferrales bacterium]
MLPLILLAASILPAPQIIVTCVDTGATVATARTQPAGGPGGLTAVLEVTSSDDYSKHSHQCTAQYRLAIVSAASAGPQVIDLLTSDADYGRSLSLSLGGFSKDGKRVLGVLSEGGKDPFTTLFDYHAGDGSVQLVDLAKPFRGVLAAGCSPRYDAIGATSSGAIVLELHSPKPCSSNGRWLLDSAGGKPRRPPPGEPILGLSH